MKTCRLPFPDLNRTTPWPWRKAEFSTLVLLLALLAAAVVPASAASSIRFRFTSHTVEENAAEAVLNVWRTGDVTTTVTAEFVTTNAAVQRRKPSKGRRKNRRQ